MNKKVTNNKIVLSICVGRERNFKNPLALALHWQVTSMISLGVKFRHNTGSGCFRHYISFTLITHLNEISCTIGIHGTRY